MITEKYGIINYNDKDLNNYIKDMFNDIKYHFDNLNNIDDVDIVTIDIKGKFDNPLEYVKLTYNFSNVFDWLENINVYFTYIDDYSDDEVFILKQTEYSDNKIYDINTNKYNEPLIFKDNKILECSIVLLHKNKQLEENYLNIFAHEIKHLYDIYISYTKRNNIDINKDLSYKPHFKMNKYNSIYLNIIKDIYLLNKSEIQARLYNFYYTIDTNKNINNNEFYATYKHLKNKLLSLKNVSWEEEFNTIYGEELQKITNKNIKTLSKYIDYNVSLIDDLFLKHAHKIYFDKKNETKQ